MAHLVDTNLLLRSLQPGHIQFPPAVNSVATLRSRSERLCLARQNLIEFRNSATRPIAGNGLGMPALDADNELSRLEHDFDILPDTDAIYSIWRRLVSEFGVIGKQVHDTRLVAVMLTYNITHLLTFNVADFMRFQTLPPGMGPGIIVVHPQSV